MNETLVTAQVGPPELLILGVLLIVGWLAHAVGRFVHVPRVTVLLLVGVVAGPSGFDLIPREYAAWFSGIAHLSLAMVGFLLGESFAGREIKESGRTVMFVSIGETLGAAIAVFAIALALQADLAVALLLAGIAPASAPAATLDVIHENHAKGPLTKSVLGVVAIDDAWGVILFSLLLVAAEALTGQHAAIPELTRGIWDVVGAILLGVGLGVPMAWFTGRLKEGEPDLLEAAGFVFICGGLALAIDVSYLLACMALGATVANRAKHHTRPFREIEGASEPFLVIFFLLAGYLLDLTALKTFGVIGIAYIIARSVGLIVGGGFAARLAGAPPVISSHVGWCLLPQAGVALGMALLVSERLPEVGKMVMPLIVATTVIFELVGPPITRWHLRKAGELQ